MHSQTDFKRSFTFSCHCIYKFFQIYIQLQKQSISETKKKKKEMEREREIWTYWKECHEEPWRQWRGWCISSVRNGCERAKVQLWSHQCLSTPEWTMQKGQSTVPSERLWNNKHKLEQKRFFKHQETFFFFFFLIVMVP